MTAAQRRAPPANEPSRPPYEALVAQIALAKHAPELMDDAWAVLLCRLVQAIEPRCSPERLLESLPHDCAALDEAGFLNTLAHLGYSCRPLDCPVDRTDPRLLPGLFVPQAGTPFLVLGHTPDGQVSFFTTADRRATAAAPTGAERGTIWVFQRYDETSQPTSKFMRKASGTGWFAALLGRFHGIYVQILVAGFVLNLIALGTPLFLMLVYDRVIGTGTAIALPMLAVGAFITIVFEWWMRSVRSAGLSWFAGRLDNVVGIKIFAQLIGLSPDLIEKASVTAQIARIKTFEALRDFFSSSSFLSILEVPFVLIAIVAVAIVAGPLVFVPLGGIVLYAILFFIVRARVKTSIRIAAKASSSRQQFTIDAFDKLYGIRSNGLTDKWSAKFRSLSGREMMAQFRLGWLGVIAETVAHAITTLSGIATVAVGVGLVWDGTITAGALVATMLLVWRILAPFYSLCTMIPRLEQLRNSVLQVDDLMELETEAEEARSASRLPALRGAVSFHNVTFRYAPTSDDVFVGLSFSAAPGDLVALTGPNGSGKSTVMRLIKALSKPTAGMVRIDGFDVRQLDAPSLRRQIAYVPRRAQFFDGTIAANLRLANPFASDAAVEAALELAAASADVAALPQGVHTVIGGSAATLSSSLATKLCLARAYLHEGSLLLIDDLPNTVMTGPAGFGLKTYLGQVKGQRTVILTTYRDDFLRLADTIVLLRHDRPPLVGPREDMVEVLKTAAA